MSGVIMDDMIGLTLSLGYDLNGSDSILESPLLLGIRQCVLVGNCILRQWQRDTI